MGALRLSWCSFYLCISSTGMMPTIRTLRPSVQPNCPGSAGTPHHGPALTHRPQHAPHPAALLRLRHQRPGRRAAEERDELKGSTLKNGRWGSGRTTNSFRPPAHHVAMSNRGDFQNVLLLVCLLRTEPSSPRAWCARGIR